MNLHVKLLLDALKYVAARKCAACSPTVPTATLCSHDMARKTIADFEKHHHDHDRKE